MIQAQNTSTQKGGNREMNKHWWYKGHYIERAYNGMYVTRGDHSYLKADTLRGLYALIDNENQHTQASQHKREEK